MISSIRQKIRAQQNKKRAIAREDRRYAVNKEEQLRRYAEIVEQHPENVVSPATEQMLLEYSNDVFGSARHVDSLRRNTAFCGEFVEGWIPWCYYIHVLLPSWNNHAVFGAKTISRRLLEPNLLPDLAYLVRGCWLDAQYAQLNASEVKKLIFKDTDTVYVKTDMGGMGEGVLRVKEANFDIDKVASLGDLVIQSPLTQHAFFDQFTTSNLATLRITTVKQFGEDAVCPGSHVRIGADNLDVVDTIKSVEVGVLGDTGALTKYGIMDNATRVEKHQGSGIHFEGLSIPHYRKALKVCKDLHDKLPHLRIIGWDVAIGAKGEIKLIEMNTSGPGFDGCQVLVGPVFANFGWQDEWKEIRKAKANPAKKTIVASLD